MFSNSKEKKNEVTTISYNYYGNDFFFLITLCRDYFQQAIKYFLLYLFGDNLSLDYIHQVLSKKNN